jgi:hypothetical protein
MAPSDDTAINGLIAAVEAMRVEAQTNSTGFRADLQKNADAMTGMQAAMAAFNVTTANLQAAIDKNAKDSDAKLTQLAVDLRKWATNEFASASSSSGLPAGAPASKRARSADSASRAPPRHFGTAQSTSTSQPEGFCVWVGGFVRKCPTPVLHKAANDLLTKYSLPGTNFKIVARSMATGLKIYFEDNGDAKDFLASIKNDPFDWQDPLPRGANQRLFARFDRSAADRTRVGLMTILWGLIHPLLADSMNWDRDTHRLRSTGAAGVLWIDDTSILDGYELATIKFYEANTSFDWHYRNLTYYGINGDQLETIRADALAEWRDKFDSA